jgi:hypothetical protein
MQVDICADFANAENIGQSYANAQNNMILGQGQGAYLGVSSNVLGESLASTAGANIQNPAQ